jgi:hypothetical protein
VDKYYYGAYQKGNKYIIITAANKTHNEAWQAFKQKDKQIRGKYRSWHLDNLYGHWYGVLAITKYIEVDDYPFGIVEIKGA